MEFLVISGLSGSGKSRAATVLEDIGYYTVDNLPAEMMVKFADFCAASESRYSKVAMVYDVRAGEPFEKLIEAIGTVRSHGYACRMLFLDCDTKTLINRYKETRRTHPLQEGGLSIEQAVAAERELLKCVKAHADIVLDTSGYSTAKQRSALIELFGSVKDQRGLCVVITSFGYKYGIPAEVDLAFDVRFLPNPYYVAELKEKTGLDSAVRNFVFSYPQTGAFVDKLTDLLAFLLPHYNAEGKSVLVIGIGCTGGHHRSVAIAEELFHRMQNTGVQVTLSHRDLQR